MNLMIFKNKPSIKIKRIAVLIFNSLLFLSCRSGEILLVDHVLGNKKSWVIEQQTTGIVNFEDNKIEIIDANGCTIWYKNQLEGHIKIAYDVTVIDAGGPFDRVSDVNCFWMATDPKNTNDFFKNSKVRAGKFSNYHALQLYYVGYGGHDNTKTRFRKYDGNIERPLLPEHDLSDKKFLITANKKMHVEIVVNNNLNSYSKDGEVIFKINDPKPYKRGYFGFRTVNNHMIIENFKVTILN